MSTKWQACISTICIGIKCIGNMSVRTSDCIVLRQIFCFKLLSKYVGITIIYEDSLWFSWSFIVVWYFRIALNLLCYNGRISISDLYMYLFGLNSLKLCEHLTIAAIYIQFLCFTNYILIHQKNFRIVSLKVYRTYSKTQRRVLNTMSAVLVKLPPIYLNIFC